MAAPAPSHPDRTDWLTVALVFAAALLAAAQFGKLALAAGPAAAAFGAGAGQIAALISVVGLVGLVFGAMAGGVAAALGPGRTFLGGLVLGGALSLAQALLPPLGGFAALRGLEGVAHLALVVAGPPLMAAAASDAHRPLVMGLWALFFGTALALLAWIVPPTLAAGGVPLLFALHGGAMLLLVPPLARRLSHRPPSRPQLNPVALHAAIYGRVRLVAPALAFAPYTFAFLAAVTYLPTALDRPGLAATLSLLTMGTTLAGGALCRRIAPHRVAALGHAGTALGALGIGLGLPGAVPLCFLAMGLVPGACFAAIPALNRDQGDRARATGAIAQLGNLGTVTGPPAFAAALAAGGAGAVIALLVLAPLLGMAAALWAGGRAWRAPG
jgi:hypothetical protein